MVVEPTPNREPRQRRGDDVYRGMPWHRSWWVRGPVFAVVVPLAGLLSLTPSAWVSYPIPVRVLAGIGVGLFVLAFWALLFWAVTRLSRGRPPYTRIMLAFPMAILLCVVASEAGQRRSTLEPGIFCTGHCVIKPTAASAIHTASMETRRGQYVDYSLALARTVAPRAATGKAYYAWASSKDPFSPAALAQLKIADRVARQHQTLVDRLRPGPDEQPEQRSFRYEAALLSKCVREIRSALGIVDRTKRISRADAANRDCASSDRIYRQAVTANDKLYDRLGGTAALPDFPNQVEQAYGG